MSKLNGVSNGVPLCVTCGKAIPLKKIKYARAKHTVAKYCSQECRRYEQNLISLKDPRNSKEEEELSKAIEQSKQQLRDSATQGKIPIDDKPSTEVELRNQLSPRGFTSNNETNSTKYESILLVQDYVIESPKWARELRKED